MRRREGGAGRPGRVGAAWRALAAARWVAGRSAAALLAASLAQASPVSLPAASKLDPRLLAAARTGGEQPVAVWVSFPDKGEQGPSDLAAALVRAEAALTPRARARRERAHVWPLVDYRDLPVDPGYLDALRARGLAPIAVSRWENRAAVRIGADRLEATAELPFVARIEPVERAMRIRDEGEPVTVSPRPPRGALAATSAVDYGGTLKQLTQIGVPAVHDSGYIGTGVLVCFLDDGFRAADTHEALVNVDIPPGMRRDFVDGDTVLTDSQTAGSHGTWTLGCVAGNKPGTYVGAAFGATFALARTEVDAFERPVEMLYWGMGAEWADSLGADLISSSLGYSVFDSGYPSYTYADMNGHTTTISRAAEIAASKGILVVNSAGNSGASTWHYIIAPADVNGDSLIAVGAVDSNGVITSFSSRGPSADGRIKPDLCALGSKDTLVSAWDYTHSMATPHAYTRLSGTSFSCPLVSGLAACILQARPAWTPRQVIQALRASASRALDPDSTYGYGIPNGLAVLRLTPDTAGVPTHGSGPLRLSLLGPNPVTSDAFPARVRFGLAADADGPRHARIRVHDAQGRTVRELWSGMLVPGWPEPPVTWDGRDRDGRVVGHGIYWVALEGGDRVASLRIVSMR